MEIPQKDVIVGEQWLVLSKIGEGSFGEVFKAQDVELGGFYAVKREALDLEHPQLHHEKFVYDLVAGGPCIPKCHWYGQHDGFDCIVIDLLGKSLKQMQADETPTLARVIDIGCQLIACLEHIHDKGMVYRDIKPENFLYNTQATSLYVVDFGLATWWRNPKTKRAYPESKKPIKFKTGTARYASLNVHRGRTHSRRDDMESLAYVLLDLLLAGNLPWSGIKARSCKAGWDRLQSVKESLSAGDLCVGLPVGIQHFIEYTRNLRFMDRPDYRYLASLLIGSNLPGPYSKLVTRKKDVFLMDSLLKELPIVNTTTDPFSYRNKSSSSNHRTYYKRYYAWNTSHT
ncbi:hypothetical protein INT47_006441 [Mucor saturninus]|uniref:non-specific serine/threonine protein kinase n=1 Tax=Mucor saturninus TaxID=64648 RepID=A0A8H7QIA5_9FUNG|nr:hypothetical protein INT47_006441 [Mucor saturninus]